jgi:predicted permease
MVDHLQYWNASKGSRMMLNAVWLDLRYGLRTLLRSPLLVVITALSLGLGTGVNTTIFSVATGLLLEEPTARDPRRLLHIEIGQSNEVSYPNYRDIDDSNVLDGLTGYTTRDVNWHDGIEIRRALSQIVTANFFEVLGTHVFMGRTFSHEEGRPERQPRVTVISYGFWRNRLQADSGVVGRSLVVNGESYTVIGVLPKSHRSLLGFGFLPELYLPATEILVPDLRDRRIHTLSLIGRIKVGTTREQVRAALAPVVENLERTYPKENLYFNRVRALYALGGLERIQQDVFLSPLLAFFSLLFVVVQLVLLIACANVAGLLLARGAARRREIAIRVAVGATRAQIIRQLLAESFLLAVAGTATGLLINLWLAEVISRIPLPLSIPFEPSFGPDGRLLIYTLVIGLATVLFCGLVPALQASRPEVVGAMKNEELFSNRRFTLRNCLVVGQVSVSVVLLMTALLFLRNLFHTGAVNTGFDVEHTMTAEVRLPATPSRGLAFAEQAREHLSRLSGITSAGYAGFLPLGFNGKGSTIRKEGRADHEGFSVNIQFVGPEYFSTLHIPVVQGREFSPADQRGGTPVALINETLARRHFSTDIPVRQRIVYGFDKQAKLLEIVGVVKDSKYSTLGEEPHPVLYLPWTDGPTVFIVARTAGAPGAQLKPVRNALSMLAPSFAIEVKTMRDHLALAFVPSRIGAVLLGALGILGLSLAIVGLYGLLAHVVARRTREIGIRFALGASHRDILWMMLGDGLMLVGIGTVIGSALALIAARSVSALLATGVSPHDPVALFVVMAIMLLAGAAATIEPARRASRIEPMVALRCD